MSTQLQEAVKGKITPEMLEVSKFENVDPRWLRNEIALGRIVIPKNKNHNNFSVRGIGKGLATKINTNIGTSEVRCNLNEEIEKMKVAIKYGTDSIMDLSTGGNLRMILQKIIENCTVMIGTVPIYSAVTKIIREGKSIKELDPKNLFEEIKLQAQMGVDFMTLHCGITKYSLRFLEDDKRLCGVVSRGGMMIKKWMIENNAENPLYEDFEKILDICEEYDVTISLGDGLRPGCGVDASDRGQIAELLVLGELVDKARARGIQVMVEGPGHVPLDQIEMNVKIMKKVCHDAPFYVLGPLVTDSAPGYDHIVGAIGGAIAASYGADFLCYVTPAEHLCLPNIDDVKQGVIASKIAARAADIVKNVGNARQYDYKISEARRNLDWETIFNNAIDPQMARKRKLESESKNEDYCSMCGSLCVFKLEKNKSSLP